MVVILMLLTLAGFLGVDWVKTRYETKPDRGTMYTTPGFEMLGALAQDGGELVTEQNDWQI